MIAGALQRERDFLPRPCLDLFPGERDWPLDQSAHVQPPFFGPDNGPVVVADGEKVVVGSNPGMQLLPIPRVQLAVVLHDLVGRCRSLIQKGDRALALAGTPDLRKQQRI